MRLYVIDEHRCQQKDAVKIHQEAVFFQPKKSPRFDQTNFPPTTEDTSQRLYQLIRKLKYKDNNDRFDENPGLVQ